MLRAEQSRAEQSRAEQSRAEQSRAEQSRAEQSRAEQSRAEQSRAEQIDDLSSEENKYRVIPSLDIVKFICAILVVVLHTRPLKDVNTYICIYLDLGIRVNIAKLAVPFFFITSGYLCFRKTTYDKFDFTTPFTYAKKILKLYVLWTLVYGFPFFCSVVWKSEEGIIHGLLSATRIFVISGYGPLWYLSALVVAILGVAMMLKKKWKIKNIMLFGVILYLLGLLGQSYFFLIRPLEKFPDLWEALKLFRKVIVTTRNGFFEGILYVSIGMLFAYKKIVIKYIHAIVGFVVSMIVLFVEVFIINYYELCLETNYYLFLIPATFFMFYLATHIQLKQTKLTDTLRTYSMLIYYVHWWIVFIIDEGINRMCGAMNGVEGYEIHSLAKFFIVFAGSILVSKIIITLSSTQKFRWLKKFY